jgi:two-component system, cell cycle sensor histidine kinase and response regulator CckA
VNSDFDIATSDAALVQRLRDQLHLQSTILQRVANAIVITDEKATIQWVNPAFEKLTGYSRREVIGQSTRILKSGDTQNEVYAHLWRTISSGKVWDGDITNRRKDGTVYTEHMTITPVPNASGELTHFIAIKEDITAQRQLELQFRQSQKMEAVGRLAGGVAHDFNNVLMVVSSYAELLQQNRHDAAMVELYAQHIRDASLRAAGITQQLLAFSRRQVLMPTLINLNEVVNDLAGMLRSMVGEDVDLRISLAADLGAAKADSGQMGQVLMNLAVNARDAMPSGGKLLIETANVEMDGTCIRQHEASMANGNYVMLAVTDTGCGMDAAIQSHIFDPFFTTKEPGKGTGLGLATVYGIVKQSQGYVWVYSELNVGTTFKVYLPRSENAVPKSETKLVTPPKATAPAGTETILVVEDQDVLREAICDYLGSKGYTVRQAGDAEQALRESEAGPVDLLLTDLIMPGMGGAELGHIMRSRCPALRVIYMSGYTDNTVRAMQFRMDGVMLQKPFRLQELALKIRQVLAQQSKPAPAKSNSPD